MSENYYTVKDAMKYLNISKPTIYTWMDKGKLQYKETSKGRIILLSDELIKEQQELLDIYNDKIETPRQIEQADNTVNTVSNSQEIILNLIEQLSKTNAELVVAAEERGKVKLLTDNILTNKEILNKLSEDSEFYKNEYFKIKYENEKITEVNKQLQGRIKTLTAESEGIKNNNKTFLGKIFKNKTRDAHTGY